MNIAVPHNPDPGTEAAPAGAGCVVRVLGSFGIEWRGEAIAPKAWRRAHARRLLVLLGTAPRHIEPRQRLQRLLWPDFDETRARNRLNHTVHWVRQTLGGLPEPVRPRIVVHDEYLELKIPAPGGVDCAVFMELLRARAIDREDRLAHLERALALYRADLVSDGQGCDEIDNRRRWLAKQHEDALREAVNLAWALGHVEIALRRAHQLAQALEDDVDAHAQYAQLLSSAGRADAALLHLRDARAVIALLGRDATSRIDAATRAIQRQVNASKPASAAGVVPALPRLALPAPQQQMLGYQPLLQAGLAHLASEDADVLTLVGPPGCGKSLLAHHLADKAQARFAHGALKIDAGWVARPADLLTAARRAWFEATGCEVADENELLQQWSERQMLIWVDNLAVTPALAEVVEHWARTAGDVRWLVTAWTLLRIHGERSLKVDAQLLLAPAEDGGGSTPAARLLSNRTGAAPDGKAMAALERLAQLTDGSPAAMEIVAEWLQSRSAVEVQTMLTLSPSCLLVDRQTPVAKRLHLAYSVQRWLLEANAETRDRLALLASCRSALTWTDMSMLLEDSDTPGPLTQTFVEFAVRHHYLSRQVRSDPDGAGVSVSEFVVPRLAAAGLRQLATVPIGDAWRDRVAAWIERGPASVAGDCAVMKSSAMAYAAWFDDRADDIDQIRTWWCAKRPSERWLRWCQRHAMFWQLTRQPARVLAWLDDAVRDADALDDPGLPDLLLARARLREQTGRRSEAHGDSASDRSGHNDISSWNWRGEAQMLVTRRSSPASSFRTPATAGHPEQATPDLRVRLRGRPRARLQ